MPASPSLDPVNGSLYTATVQLTLALQDFINSMNVGSPQNLSALQAIQTSSSSSDTKLQTVMTCANRHCAQLDSLLALTTQMLGAMVSDSQSDAAIYGIMQAQGATLTDSKGVLFDLKAATLDVRAVLGDVRVSGASASDSLAALLTAFNSEKAVWEAIRDRLAGTLSASIVSPEQTALLAGTAFYASLPKTSLLVTGTLRVVLSNPSTSGKLARITSMEMSASTGLQSISIFPTPANPPTVAGNGKIANRLIGSGNLPVCSFFSDTGTMFSGAATGSVSVVAGTRLVEKEYVLPPGKSLGLSFASVTVAVDLAVGLYFYEVAQ